jgi:hypothetical protein
MKGKNASAKKMRTHLDHACDNEIRARVMVSDESRASLGCFGDGVSGRWKFDSAAVGPATARTGRLESEKTAEEGGRLHPHYVIGIPTKELELSERNSLARRQKQRSWG